MKITSVSVHKVTGENSRMKGIATVVLDDCRNLTLFKD